MRAYALSTLCCIALLAGCSSDDSSGGGTGGKGGSGGSSSTGGRGGSSGSGGSSSTGGSGGSTGGSGGSSSTGGSSGSGGSGGSTGGSGGSGTGGSAGTGGTPGTGGSGGSAGTGGSGGGDAGKAEAGDTTASVPGPTIPGTHSLCPNCKNIFNGTDLTGWKAIGAEKWAAQDMTILSTGVSGGALVTEKLYDHYRLFFSWKMLSGGHAANMLFLCRDATSRNCAGIQFQPPGSDLWDYGPADGRVPKDKGMLLPGRASVPQGQSGMCEMIVKHSAGTMKVACCNLMGGGAGKTCKTVPSAVVNWGSPFQPGGLGFQAHNANHKIHWWDIYVEENPTSDEYLSK